ncbi:MAG TPA: HAMP domain-containing sensor histidine kinase [Usitatibacter sp.]|nr:HAMP domain-containing sensor histidine kinase [Usitatibacter sp.]
MSRASIERRLSVVLAGAVVGVAVLAAFASFAISFNEAKEFQDDALQQVASMAPSESSSQARSQITVLHSPPDPLPGWLPAPLEPGFHGLAAPDGRSMRVFVRDGSDGRRVVVLQDMQLIDDVAYDSALQTFIPVLLLIPLIAWLSMRELAAERRRVQAERRFIANAAHELRSPLTALSLQAENLDMETLPPAARERLDALREGIGRAQRVAEQMLAMARVHGATQRPELVALPGLVRDVIADVMDLARRRGIDLGLDQRAEPEVRGTREGLALIVKNAVENAIAYSSEGGAVTVRLRAEAGDAVIEVQDDGPGMPRDFMEQAFEPYRRAVGTGKGAGLGLAIAKDAAAKLGGVIEIRNRDDAGGFVLTYRQRLADSPHPSRRRGAATASRRFG